MRVGHPSSAPSPSPPVEICSRPSKSALFWTLSSIPIITLDVNTPLVLCDYEPLLWSPRPDSDPP